MNFSQYITESYGASCKHPLTKSQLCPLDSILTSKRFSAYYNFMQTNGKGTQE